MKKCQYILFSAFLSLLIIYMGVGMPVVQYRCMKCIDTKKHTALLTVIEVSKGECTCGCADKNKKCACAAKKKSCCNEKKGEEKKKYSEQGTDEPCSKVRIEKLNLPTLTSSIHLDNMVFPMLDIFFYNFIINTDLLSSDYKKEFYADTSQHKQRQREYLHLICTLLI